MKLRGDGIDWNLVLVELLALLALAVIVYCIAAR